MNITEFNRFQAALQWAVDEAKRDESKHNQGSWGAGIPLDYPVDPTGYDDYVQHDSTIAYLPITCNTSMCLAGNGVIAAGDTFVVEVDVNDKFGLDAGEPAFADYCIDRNGVIHDIEERATELFGFDGEDSFIFYTGNDLDKLIRSAERIVGKHGFTLSLVR